MLDFGKFYSMCLFCGSKDLELHNKDCLNQVIRTYCKPKADLTTISAAYECSLCGTNPGRCQEPLSEKDFIECNGKCFRCGLEIKKL